MGTEALPTLPLNPKKCPFSLVHLQQHFQQQRPRSRESKEEGSQGHEPRGPPAGVAAAVPRPVPPPVVGSPQPPASTLPRTPTGDSPR